MFSNESVVTYPTTGEPTISVFVPIDTVRGEPGTIGKVKVQVMHYGETPVAILPTCYSESVPVSVDDLSDAP